MPRFFEEQGNIGIGMLMAGVAVKDVSQAFGCTKHKLMTRYEHTGTVQVGLVLQPWERGRVIMLTHLHQRFWPAAVTTRRYGLSTQRIRNRLRKNNNPICACRPYEDQIMKRRHRLARVIIIMIMPIIINLYLKVQWARRHFIWRRAEWNMVLFSDESRIALSHANDGTEVYRPHKRAFCGLLRAGKGSVWWGQFDGLGWDNGWLEDRVGCNARQFECSSLYRRRLASSCHTVSP